MRGAQNEASHSGAFSGSFIVVAPFGTKIGAPCIGACCVEYYIWDIIAKWWLGAHVNHKQLLSVSSAFKECGLVVSWWHCGYTSLYMEEKT